MRITRVSSAKSQIKNEKGINFPDTVLEIDSLNKSGIATRSEVSDAALSAGAECVMLNKGSYTVKVLVALKDILKRTSSHRAKKRFTFRSLKIAERFFEA